MDAARHQLAEIFREKQMRNVRTDVEQVEQLRADVKTGKFRLIVMPA